MYPFLRFRFPVRPLLWFWLVSLFLYFAAVALAVADSSDLLAPLVPLDPLDPLASLAPLPVLADPVGIPVKAASATELEQTLADLQQQIDTLRIAAEHPPVGAVDEGPRVSRPADSFPEVRLTGFFQADAVWAQQSLANRIGVGNGVAADGDVGGFRVLISYGCVRRKHGRQ